MKKTEERVNRDWWVVFERDVIQAKGFSCAPTNSYYWWFPKLQTSMAEHYHVFETEAAAIDKLVLELDKEAKKIEKKLVEYKTRLHKLR